LSGLLRRYGFHVVQSVGSVETAFRAERRGGGARPGIAFLSEYDALPGLGHACGHNLIGTAGVGAGIGLAAVLDAVPGDAIVMGTPAEEGGGGKVLLLNGGAFAGVDVSLLIHPAALTTPIFPFLASSRVEVQFEGKASHAASAPDEGVNALDAMIQLFVALGLLRQQLRDDARIHGVITHGGDAPNIIPALTRAEFSVRAADDAYQAEALAKFLACVEAAARATGTTATHQVRMGYASLKANPPLAETFTAHLTALGYPPDPLPSPVRMRSTDMGNVTQAMPAIHPYISISREPIGFHTDAFREASITDRAHDAMIASAKAMALTGLDLLAEPERLRAVRAAFDAA
jgi:amidohydrolase